MLVSFSKSRGRSPVQHVFLEELCWIQLQHVGFVCRAFSMPWNAWFVAMQAGGFVLKPLPQVCTSSILYMGTRAGIVGPGARTSGAVRGYGTVAGTCS